MSNINTLLKLLSEYKIEIPIIQRDYAQGRKDEHANVVRENLLEDIKNAISTRAKLDLNFVYGKAEDDKFIPVDGQQRLTTLFLLYIYAFAYDDSKTELFKRFTYETRTTSRKFLAEIVKNRAEIFSSPLSPKAEILDSSWFVQNWEYDPTILSVMDMLDAIVLKFDEMQDISSTLIEFEPITFNFLEMQKLGMEDSLYIKLNARGKPLSDFENFKASFISRLKDLYLDNPSHIDEIESLMDNAWTDIFWQKGSSEFDTLYINFFGQIIQPIEKKFTVRKWFHSLDYSKINEDVCDMIYHTLNFLHNNPNDEEVKRLIFDALDEQSTYREKVLFHAVTKYMQVTQGKTREYLFQWLRVMKNLILNTTIDSEAIYIRAIKSVNDLSICCNGILSALCGKIEISTFLKEQVQEEYIKAQLILNDKTFEQAIYKAEKHPYFSGQIRSALYLSKDDNEKYSLHDFEIYWSKISKLFDENGSIYKHLLRQALLTFGDYTEPVGRYTTFCVNDPDESTSTPSLKRLFSDKNFRTKPLLDKLDLNSDFESQLTNIVSTTIISETDWRYCFVKFTDLFGLMSKSHLRLKIMKDKTLIVPNKAATGYSYNLYLETLYRSLPDNLKAKSCYPTMQFGSWGNDSYLEISDMRIIYENSNFLIIVNNNEVFKTSSKDVVTEIVAYLSKIIK